MNTHRSHLIVSLAAVAALVTALPYDAARAAAPQVRTPAPAFARAMLGTTEITALSDGIIVLPVRGFLAGDRREIAADLAADRQGDPIRASDNAYLINDGKKLVLIDTGGGALLGPTLGKLVANLRAAGYRPAQVDEIYLTHFHADHVGRLVTASGARVFPNAIVRADKRESDFWLSAANLAKASPANKPFFQGAQKALRPYVAAGAFKPFSGPTTLADGITSVPEAGHTPGHTAYVLQNGGHRIAFIGDLVHVVPVQFRDPRVTVTFDIRPAQAERARASFFADAARSGEWVAAAHIAFPGIGTMRRSGSGYRWIPLPYDTVAAL